MASESPGYTLDGSALVHEAYLRLVGDHDFDGRGHFFAAAAEGMRRILVKSATGRGEFATAAGRTRRPPGRHPVDDLLALDDALDRLGKRDPVKAEVVKLRYFVGLTVPEVAITRGISVATAQRHWAFARTWLFTELNDAEENPPAV